MKAEFTFKDHYGMDDLLEIMAILRGEGGCVWDREQDHHSIRNNLIEETYEAVEAIDRDDPVLLQEELGDVLLQVVFHARMEEEEGRFGFSDICDGICKKLIYRHPHVFGDTVVKDSSQVLDNWDKLKKKEKHQSTAASTLEGVSRSLPALIRAAKVQKRAGKVGFEYPTVQDALGDLSSEILELKQAIAQEEPEQIQEEMGDVLFSAVNVSRLLGDDPEEMLYRSTEKFIRRFSAMEQAAISNDIELTQCSIDELNNLWRKVKEEEKIGGKSK
jgi:tetrapyrrole methylase family protein/MazG family protein